MWIPELRELDMEPSAKRGANKTKALVRLSWLSRTLHSKEPPNPISLKSTKLDPRDYCQILILSEFVQINKL